MKPENTVQKENYEPASIKIIRLETKDILTASGGSGSSGINLPIDPFKTE